MNKKKEKLSNKLVENHKDIYKQLEDNKEERYCTVAESLEQGLKEMQLMREGKLPKKTWRECREEWDKWAKEVEEEWGNE